MTNQVNRAQQRFSERGDSAHSTFFDRGKRIEAEIDPYMPGLTRNTPLPV